MFRKDEPRKAKRGIFEKPLRVENLSFRSVKVYKAALTV